MKIVDSNSLRMDFRIGGNANIDIAQESQCSDQFERRRVTIDPEQESDIKLCPERSVIGNSLPLTY